MPLFGHFVKKNDCTLKTHMWNILKMSTSHKNTTPKPQFVNRKSTTPSSQTEVDTQRK